MTPGDGSHSQPVLGRECAWCGLPASEVVVVTPAEFKTVKGVKQMTHREVAADACAPCGAARRGGAVPKEQAAAQRSAERKKWKAAQESLV